MPLVGMLGGLSNGVITTANHTFKFAAVYMASSDLLHMHLALAGTCCTKSCCTLVAQAIVSTNHT